MAAKTPGQGPDKAPDKARTRPSRPRTQNRAIQVPRNRADWDSFFAALEEELEEGLSTLGLHSGSWFIDMSLVHLDSKKIARIAHWLCIYAHVTSKLLRLRLIAHWRCIYAPVTSKLLTLRFQNLPRLHTGCHFMHMPLPSSWHFDSKNCQDYILAMYLLTCHFQVIDTSLPKAARIIYRICIYLHVNSKLLTLRFQNLPGLLTSY